MGPSGYTRKDARRVAHRDRPQPVSHSESEVTQLGSNMMLTRAATSSGAGLWAGECQIRPELSVCDSGYLIQQQPHHRRRIIAVRCAKRKRYFGDEKAG